VGDYNNDGTVDAADYVVWRKILGQSVMLPNRDNANSGPISIDDYETLRAQFGEAACADDENGTSVPEPSAVLLCLVSIALFAGDRGFSS
jgi:hypothetical protein